MRDMTVLVVCSICFALCQWKKKVHKDLGEPWIMLCIRAIWGVDAQRLSMLMLERAACPNPTFSKGFWVCMCFWIAGALFRSMELSSRIRSDKLVYQEPHQRFHLLSIPGCIALIYLCFLMWFSNCKLMGGMNVSDCDDEHANVYSLWVYAAVLFHLRDGMLSMKRKAEPCRGRNEKPLVIALDYPLPVWQVSYIDLPFEVSFLRSNVR